MANPRSLCPRHLCELLNKKLTDTQTGIAIMHLELNVLNIRKLEDLSRHFGLSQVFLMFLNISTAISFTFEKIGFPFHI